MRPVELKEMARKVKARRAVAGEAEQHVAADRRSVRMNRWWVFARHYRWCFRMAQAPRA